MTSKAKPIILVIDDDTVILHTVVSTLKSEYSIRPFTSGKEALAFLKNNYADLILLDCQMPGMDGFDVLRQLQSTKARSIPVIFITGSAHGKSEVDALEMGAVDYLRKPIKSQALLTRVRLQLELQQHRKNLEAMVEEKTHSLNAAYLRLKIREEITLNILACVTDLRDSETGNHIVRTTELVRIIVTDLLAHPCPGYVLSAEEGEDIIKSTKLHDLGKIATPDRILHKPGQLTSDEYETIKAHPEWGEKLLTDFIQGLDDSFLKTARDIIHTHHECWDGSGYPNGLQGTAIPLSGRIVAIADVYDALTSTRSYKEAFSHEEAIKIIQEKSGSHFDPHLVTVFIRHSQDIPRLSHC